MTYFGHGLRIENKNTNVVKLRTTRDQSTLHIVWGINDDEIIESKISIKNKTE